MPRYMPRYMHRFLPAFCPRLLCRCLAACAMAGPPLAAAPALAQGVVPAQPVAATWSVATESRPRCGEALALPAPSLWGRVGAMFGAGPSGDEVPAPVFERVRRCTDEPVRNYGPAHYRFDYQFGGEDYRMDLPYDPGRAVRLDETGSVLGAAAAR